MISEVIAFKHLFYFTLECLNVDISCISLHFFSIALRQYQSKVLTQHLDLLLLILFVRAQEIIANITHVQTFLNAVTQIENNLWRL